MCLGLGFSCYLWGLEFDSPPCGISFGLYLVFSGLIFGKVCVVNSEFGLGLGVWI